MIGEMAERIIAIFGEGGLYNMIPILTYPPPVEPFAEMLLKMTAHLATN